MRRRLSAALLAALGAAWAGVAPVAAGAGVEVLLDEASALALAVPEAAEFRSETTTLAEEARARVEKALGAKLPSSDARFHVGLRDGRVVGYATVLEELGKHEIITFVVGLTDAGAVSAVAVMVYREPRGGEVRHRRFLAQYAGKTASSPLRVGREITAVTGATLSSHAVTRGVRRALALWAEVYGRGEAP